jgi:hypothetical protein
VLTESKIAVLANTVPADIVLTVNIIYEYNHTYIAVDKSIYYD